MASVVASQLHTDHRSASGDVRGPRGALPPTPMAKDLQSRFFAVLLALLSVAAVVFAGINFQKDREYSTPYDGVWWVEDGGHLRAQRVDVNGAGTKGRHQAGRPAGRSGRPQYQQCRQPGAAAIPRGHLVQHQRTRWCAREFRLRRPLILEPADRTLYDRPAADRAGVPRHRPIRPVAALDRAQEHSLLRLLPGVVHLLLLPLHRQAQRL